MRYSAVLCAAFVSAALSAVPAGLWAQSADNTLVAYTNAFVFRVPQQKVPGEGDARLPGATRTNRYRVDLFSVVPYSSLRFSPVAEGKLRAKYTIVATLIDSLGTPMRKLRRDRVVTADSYLASISAAAEADFQQLVGWMPAGRYTVETAITDELANKTHTHKRTITVLDFEAYPFTLSSVLYVSSLVVSGDKTTITPHIPDNVTPIAKDGFFAFFESYNLSAGLDSVDFVWKVKESPRTSAAVLSRSASRLRRSVAGDTRQHYLRIDIPQTVPSGDYVLEVMALEPSADTSTGNARVLAATERTLQISWSLAGGHIGGKELDEALRKMRYACSSEEYAYVNEAPNEVERRERFHEFWAKLDPTPGTSRNEAFEQYYARVEYVDKTFRQYSEGWLTDQGRVYIVLGKPANAQRQQRMDGRVVEVWNYGDGRQFVFVDYTGFGDYRLAQPMGFAETYRWRGND